MNKILCEIDNNIMRKKINIMTKDIKQMNEKMDDMNGKIENVNDVYKKLLFKKSPVGSSSNAIRYLKTQQ